MYTLAILFSNIVKYFIAAVAEITDGVVNQWLLVIDARIVLKWIMKNCKVVMVGCFPQDIVMLRWWESRWALRILLSTQVHEIQ